MRYSFASLAVAAILASSPLCAEPQQPGHTFLIDPATLPAPHASDSANDPPDVVDRPATATLDVPAGFKASLVTAGVPHARKMAVAPNGDIFVARSKDGVVSVVREGSNGAPATVSDYVDGFDRPYGLQFHSGSLYIADGRGVFRIPYTAGDVKAAAEPVQVTPNDAFGDTGGPGGHWTRNLVFAPDGQHFFVAIGSKDNIGENPLPRASVQEFDADGANQRTFVTGTRNPIGLGFYPGTNDLYTVVNERDTLGDGLVPDYFTRLTEGGFYGWPYAYIGAHPQPGELGTKRPDLVAQTIVPDVLFDSHSAPLDLVFYTGSNFPAQYHNQAFVTLHGSWNKSDSTGYKIVMIPFENGRPKNEYSNFATGFRLDDGTARPAKVWGRPVGVAIAKDGGLLVSDDEGGTIWAVRYVGQ